MYMGGFSPLASEKIRTDSRIREIQWLTEVKGLILCIIL